MSDDPSGSGVAVECPGPIVIVQVSTVVIVSVRLTMRR
jgi:hypothetical protein